MPLGHTLISIFGKKISKIEKIMTAFSIPNKIFLKIESLICIFRALNPAMRKKIFQEKLLQNKVSWWETCCFGTIDKVI